jgi:hypothetical protein
MRIPARHCKRIACSAEAIRSRKPTHSNRGHIDIVAVLFSAISGIAKSGAGAMVRSVLLCGIFAIASQAAPCSCDLSAKRFYAST